jgi:hypothetical protein
MGPPILLDKSGVQFLPRKLLPALSKYYLFVVTPILVQEILGDLPKAHQGGSEWMRILSEKIQSGFFCVNMDHRDLRAASLLGKPITMDGRPVVEAQEFDTTLGKGVLVTETKEHWQLLRWQSEKLTPFDEQSAKEWKEFISTVNLEKTKAHLKLANSEMPKVKSFAELGAAVDTLLGFGDQRILLEMCITDAHLNEESQEKIRTRWAQIENPKLWSFAPYAFFCFRIRMLFHVGLVNDLVSTRNSNTADILYLYYVPFCNVFSSNDKLHESFAPLVLKPDQYFIRTSALRSDFEAIEYFREYLSTDQKRMWLDRFGDWPPRNSGSFTYKMWTRKMILPAGLRRGNALKGMSPDAKKKLDAHVRETMRQFKEIQEQLKNCQK